MKKVQPLDDDLLGKLAALDATEPFASMSIEDAVVAYNEPTLDFIGCASSSLLNKWCAVNGARKAIMQASNDFESPAYESAAAARFALENTAEYLDLSDPETQSLVAAMVTAGLITQASADDLYARVTTKQSHGQSIGIPKVRTAYLEWVREGS